MEVNPGARRKHWGLRAIVFFIFLLGFTLVLLFPPGKRPLGRVFSLPIMASGPTPTPFPADVNAVLTEHLSVDMLQNMNFYDSYPISVTYEYSIQADPPVQDWIFEYYSNQPRKVEISLHGSALSPDPTTATLVPVAYIPGFSGFGASKVFTVSPTKSGNETLLIEVVGVSGVLAMQEGVTRQAEHSAYIPSKPLADPFQLKTGRAAIEKSIVVWKLDRLTHEELTIIGYTLMGTITLLSAIYKLITDWKKYIFGDSGS